MKPTDKLYSIDSHDGVLTIVERSIDWVSSRTKGSYKADVLINPKFEIKEGVLKVVGQRHSFKSIYTMDSSNSWCFNWLPEPTRDLDEGWEDSIFYNEDDLVYREVKSWTGHWYTFNLKRKVEKNVQHLMAGYYLKQNGWPEEITTSNFKIVE